MWIKNKQKRKKQHKPDSRGTSMVTVVISFALLLVFVTSFYRIQRVSQDMMMSARDLILNNNQLLKAYYLKETSDTVVLQDAPLYFSGGEGSFSITTTLHKAEKEGLSGSIYYYESQTKEQTGE